jgi:mono/diheme cytochrome c family protein
MAKPCLITLAAATLWLASLPAAATDAGLVSRGRYLATAADCEACHTAPGGKPFAGARALETPFGTIYSRNLTPDNDTGLGRWTDEDFYRALHHGKSRDGALLYPAFPYPYFTAITREDAAAIKAFLGTLDPVHADVPRNEFPWPLDHRFVMHGWNLLFFDEGSPPARQAAGPAQGRYLVEALGHCGACHTPKNALGADKRGQYLQGGEIQGWFAPNLTGDARTGLGSWDEADIVEYLKTGRNARALASGPMSEVIEYSTSRLEDADLAAIAAYLKGVPAGAAAPLAEPDRASMRAGEAIFVDSCSACHGSDGTAVPRAFAPLKGSAVVQSVNPATVIRIILEGAQATPTPQWPTAFSMPAYAWKLSDAQVAAVSTYVRNAWGNQAAEVKPAQVQKVRDKIRKAG